VGRNDEAVALLKRCIAGEPGAWREFVDLFAATVRALARRYLKLHGQYPDDGTLDDVVQDVMLAITRRDYRLLRNYNPEYTVKTYLGVITRTEVHRALRKKRPYVGTPDDLESTAAGDDRAVEQAEERELLTCALEQLSDRRSCACASCARWTTSASQPCSGSPRPRWARRCSGPSSG